MRQIVRCSALVLAAVLGACGGGDDPTPSDESAAGPQDRSLASTGRVERQTVERPDYTENLPPEPFEPVTESAEEPQAFTLEDAAAPPSLPVPDDLILPLSAIGTEPYWNATVSEDWIVFDRPGLPEIDAPFTGFEPQDDGKIALMSSPLSMLFSKETCPDPTSGATYGLSVTITFEDIDYAGCAFANDASDHGGAAADDWSDLVPLAYAGVSACLDEAAAGSLVTALYPREGGLIGMVIETPEGRRYECGVASEGGELAFLDHLAPGTETPWMESSATFIRGVDRPSGCQDVDGKPIQVSGETVGHYLYERCD